MGVGERAVIRINKFIQSCIYYKNGFIGSSAMGSTTLPIPCQSSRNTAQLILPSTAEIAPSETEPLESPAILIASAPHLCRYHQVF